MRLIVAVYDALRASSGPCSRLHIEQITGLTKYEVRNGLDGLRARRLLLVHGRPREAATYELKPNAQRPEDLRGRNPRTDEVRARIAAGVSRYRASAAGRVLTSPAREHVMQRAACAPAHRAMPGVARTTLATLHSGCLLQQLWRKR